jgi:hypothetical protein
MLDIKQEAKFLHIPIMLVRFKKAENFDLVGSVELYDDNNTINATLSYSFIDTYREYIKIGSVMCIEMPPILTIDPFIEIFIDKENLVFLVFNTTDGGGQPFFKSITIKDTVRISEDVKILEKTIILNYDLLDKSD